MGPQSKQHVCDALEGLISAVAGMEATLVRIERLLVARNEHENADLVQVNQRVSTVERWIHNNGGAPLNPPAE